MISCGLPLLTGNPELLGVGLYESAIPSSYNLLFSTKTNHSQLPEELEVSAEVLLLPDE